MKSTPQNIPVNDTKALVDKERTRGRCEGSRILNRLRLITAVCFTLTYAVAIYYFKIPNLDSTFPMVLIYLAMAFFLWMFGGIYPKFALVSRWAIPLLDMPLVFLIQGVNLAESQAPVEVALFTLGVFVFLVTLSSYAMGSFLVFISAFVGTCGYLVLLHTAEGSTISYLTGPVLLFLTAWVVEGIPRKALKMISKSAAEQSLRDQLSLYFSPGVAQAIEEEGKLPESEKCEVTVLFCDIRGFTSFSENHDAPEVVAFLNQFLGLMVKEVYQHGGTMDKYLGDGLMAYFNAPVRQQDHALRAIDCAMAMNEIIDDCESYDLGEVEIGIGIHSGMAVVGSIGAAHRREFTVIGDTVNVASRIQALTQTYKTPVLISEETMRLATENTQKLPFKQVGEVPIRGREGGVTLFSPKESSDNFSQISSLSPVDGNGNVLVSCSD